MIKSFDFYFDFISPYSFLAHKQIRKIENKDQVYLITYNLFIFFILVKVPLFKYN